MTTPAEITELFKSAIDEFDIDKLLPNVRYYDKMVRVMFDILIDVPYNKHDEEHNLVGIILEDAAYNKLYGKNFEIPMRPKAVEEEFKAEDAVTVGSRLKELVHAARKADFKLY